MQIEIERRVMDAHKMEVRQSATGSSLVGYAAVFDSLSELIADFRELIRPGAFGAAIAEGQDVRALYNHDPSQILGRTTAGTLRLSQTQVGLRYEVDLPDTTTARDLATSVERGDISASSFAFRVRAGGEDWRQQEDGSYQRELTALDLFDVSPVVYPAYQATDGMMGMRSLETYKDRWGHHHINVRKMRLALAQRIS